MIVALVSATSLLRRLLERHLLEFDGIDEVLAWYSERELLDSIDHGDPPDVVIFDIDTMPDAGAVDGLPLALRLRAEHPGLAIVVLAYRKRAGVAQALMGLGWGVGYVLKDSLGDIDGLLQIISKVSHGEVIIDSSEIARAANYRVGSLTAREAQVLDLMSMGYSNKGIAQALMLGPRTVENHAGSIYHKLGVTGSSDINSRVAAVLAWMRSQQTSAHTAR